MSKWQLAAKPLLFNRLIVTSKDYEQEDNFTESEWLRTILAGDIGKRVQIRQNIGKAEETTSEGKLVEINEVANFHGLTLEDTNIDISFIVHIPKNRRGALDWHINGLESLHQGVLQRFLRKYIRVCCTEDTGPSSECFYEGWLIAVSKRQMFMTTTYRDDSFLYEIPKCDNWEIRVAADPFIDEFAEEGAPFVGHFMNEVFADEGRAGGAGAGGGAESNTGRIRTADNWRATNQGHGRGDHIRHEDTRRPAANRMSARGGAMPGHLRRQIQGDGVNRGKRYNQ